MGRRGTPRIGVIYGGVYWQKMPYEEISCDVHFIDLLEESKKGFERVRLTEFDIIIVPWAPDQEFLARIEDELVSFLRRGGVLISFGEDEKNWIPHAFWRPNVFEEIEILERSPIFSDLESKDLSKWYNSAHGYFFCVPEKARIIATGRNEQGESCATMYIDETSYRPGVILASTIDPDFHTYNGIEPAKTLLKNIVDWAINESLHIHKENMRLAERILSFLRLPSVRKIFLSLLATMLTGLISYLIINFVLHW